MCRGRGRRQEVIYVNKYVYKYIYLLACVHPLVQRPREDLRLPPHGRRCLAVLSKGLPDPNLYKIRLLSGRDGSRIFRNIGTPIKFSYLQSIEANYSRNQGEGLFKNGAPTHVQLSLNFKEYKALDRQDVLFLIFLQLDINLVMKIHQIYFVIYQFIQLLLIK